MVSRRVLSANPLKVDTANIEVLVARLYLDIGDINVYISPYPTLNATLRSIVQCWYR
jgi:hypothetical protein